MNNPLVSIIIPTFNRAHLIRETLDSVLEQTYTNWECIVVDDGSTDNTKEVLSLYCKKDTRFQYYHRPGNLRKGANSCRNYGFEMSKGEYINWFDSDDIMHSDFIKVKQNSLSSQPDYDFVVTRGVNFHENGTLNNISIRNNKIKKLDHNNFVLFEVFWITQDFFVRKNKVDKLRFDPEIRSGQEYNFFIKVMAINNLKGFFVDDILFKRRMHENSIQGKFDGNDDTFCFDQYILYRNTFLAVSNYLNKEARAHLFRRIPSRAFELKRRRLKTPKLKVVIKLFKKEKGIFKTMLFITSLITAYLFGVGFRLMDLSRQ